MMRIYEKIKSLPCVGGEASMYRAAEKGRRWGSSNGNEIRVLCINPIP